MSHPYTILSPLPFALALALSGCATQSASQQLAAARVAYQNASSGPAGTEVPSKVHEAKVALAQAERAHERDARSDEEKDLAYIAERKSLLAQQEAEKRIALRKIEGAEGQKSAVLRDQRDNARQEANTLSSELGSTSDALEQERTARAKAEKEAEAALQSLNKIASIQSENNRTVITLSGSVLFETNRATLLPIAENRLMSVAQALQAQGEDKSIQVLGYTDSSGSDSHNQQLSLERAQAVARYLGNNGVSSDRMTAVGKGEQNPIATNASAEGRANNRRVEIVIEGGRSGGSSPQAAR